MVLICLTIVFAPFVRYSWVEPSPKSAWRGWHICILNVCYEEPWWLSLFQEWGQSWEFPTIRFVCYWALKVLFYFLLFLKWQKQWDYFNLFPIEINCFWNVPQMNVATLKQDRVKQISALESRRWHLIIDDSPKLDCHLMNVWLKLSLVQFGQLLKWAVLKDQNIDFQAALNRAKLHNNKYIKCPVTSLIVAKFPMSVLLSFSHFWQLFCLIAANSTKLQNNFLMFFFLQCRWLENDNSLTANLLQPIGS